MRMIVAAMLLTSLLRPASAQSVEIVIVGIGNSSCASWLSSAVSESAGIDWVYGFWSGNNHSRAMRRESATVGSSTDGAGIIGALKKRCAADPAAPLGQEAGKLYREFLKAGK
jgi:hypothetical protein